QDAREERRRRPGRARWLQRKQAATTCGPGSGVLGIACGTNRHLRLVTTPPQRSDPSSQLAATGRQKTRAWAQFWSHSSPSGAVHRCSARSRLRSSRTVATAGERRSALLEGVLGATPREFESRILRHAELRRREAG